MTLEQLAEIRKRVKAATPGPWVWVSGGGFEVLVGPGYDPEFPSVDKMMVMDDGSAGGEYGSVIDSRCDNGKFIAGAPTDVNALLNYVDELEEKLRVAVAAAEAFQELNVCYRRVGKSPSMKLFDRLDKARDFLTKLKGELK